MATISIVIPCYNAEKYIEKCLSSMANQIYKDFSLILVDDCSTDNTFLLAMETANRLGLSAKFLKNEKNSGPSLTRRNGIAVADSEYIAFCDSDDWYEADYLSSMVENANNGTNDIVFCNFKTVYSNGNIVEHDVISGLLSCDKKNMVGRSFDSLCCMMVRRSIFQNLAFPNIRNGEDMAIIPVLVASAASYGFVNECVYNYNYHEGSLSKTFSNTMMESLKISFEYIRSHLSAEYPVETEFLGIRNYLYGGLLNLFKKSLDIKAAKDVLNYFEAQYPNWENNDLFDSLPSYKRYYLTAAKKRMFVLCRVFSVVHKMISK